MTRSRRDILNLGTASVAGGLLAAGCSSSADEAPSPAFVLVHGAWHGAWCYAKLIPELAALGYTAVAVDLPGHGLDAKFPASWHSRPLDAAAFATEVSPLAGVTVQQCVDRVVSAIDQLRAGGHQKIILLGHSLGGVTITAVAEAVPEKLHKLVYLTAWMIANGQAATDASAFPEAATAKVPALFLANPATVAAIRLDPASTDGTYFAAMKAAFYNDLDDVQVRAAANLLTPDEPIALGVTPAAKTVARWGSLPRHYIQCQQDQAIPLALQQRLVADADSFNPQNKTTVHSLNTSHSPFLSAPHDLASVLDQIARS